MNNYKLTVMVFMVTVFAFLALQNNITHAYVISTENITRDTTNMTIRPLYCTPPACPFEDRFYFDAPWRVNPTAQLSVYGIINWEYYTIKRVAIYDDITGDLIAERIFDEGLSPNASQIPYTINFSINANNLSRINNRAILRMIYTTSLLGVEYDNTEGPINITLSEEPLPTLNNWYYGDTHYHSSYTQNAVEFGAILPATINAMNAIGLDWITVTDHSFTLKTDEKWNAFKGECNSYSNCLISEEISCDNEGPLDYNHYLGYNITNRIYSGEYLDNGTSPLQCIDVVNQVNSQGGFGYTAHPFYREGYYKDGFGLAFRNIWQDYNLPFTGMEIWNHEENIAELEQGIEKWKELLNSSRHIFISAGSDAHGDFNSALGKVRTACFARNFTKDNIFTALKNGNCMMTDGPIVVFTANKHIIGESFNVSEGDNILLNISWNSTNEFGNVTEIFLIRGEIQGTEINETILLPNNLSGNFILTSTPNNTYYRVEARSIDSKGTVRRAYTNPIWATAEPKPEVEKIPMDETELALVARFENKYGYSLKNLFFDAEPNLNCDETALRENLDLNSSWHGVKCEKMFINNTRLMWAGFNNTETSENKVFLQVGNTMQFTNASYNPFVQSWSGGWPGGGTYKNNNWIAYKNGAEVFEINEIYNTNACPWNACSSYFGTYLLYGFKKYDGNTTAYFTHWGYGYKPSQGIQSIFFLFDEKTLSPLANSHTPNTEGIMGMKTFVYDASTFSFGADGVYMYMSSTGTVSPVGGAGFDSINRSIFPIMQTNAITLCHADIDCNDGDLLTNDVCANAGTTNSNCEYNPQELKEIKKPFTEMDADEVSKTIDFRKKYNSTLNELYFDGWKNTTCNNAGILETLKLDNNWSIIQCQKFLINNTLAMFAGFNNTQTGQAYVAYQLGNVIIDEIAENKQVSEMYRVGNYIVFMTYYENRWSGIKENVKRFEISDISAKFCDGVGRCSSGKYGTYIFHGFHVDENKNTSILYSFYKKTNEARFNILFDNYKSFSIDNETMREKLYESKLFNYSAINGWALGTYGFNYPLYNRSIFPPYRANELIVGLESPAHLRAQDSIGRIIGYANGTYITEIPDSEILDTEHEKYLLPANETYRFFVEGYTDGNYSLKITRASGENSSTIYFKNISATNETRDIFEINEIASIGIKTNDSEKNIIVALDSIEGVSENIEFTTAKNKSISISVLNWSALNESTTITEIINYPPEIISKYPENGSVFGIFESISIGLDATDENNDSLEYIISFDGVELTREKEINYTLSNAGNHTINFIASDGLNTISEEIFVSVRAAPKVMLINPKNTTYNSSTILLNASFGELVDTAWIVLDNSPSQNYTNNVSSISMYLNGLADGAHKIRAYANNSIGMENHSEIFFTINTTLPVIIPPPNNGGDDEYDQDDDDNSQDDDDGADDKPKNKPKKDKDDKEKENKKPKQDKREKDDFKDTTDFRKNTTENYGDHSDEKDDAPPHENHDSRYTERLLNMISENMQKLAMMLKELFGL